MKLMKRMNSKKGMTLVEVLVSSSIFALIIVGVTGVFIISVNASKKIDYEYIATNIAKNRIEHLRFINYSLLLKTEESDTKVDKNSVPDDEGEFLRSTDITPNYGGNTHLTEVKVDVYYMYKGSKSLSPAIMRILLSDIR